MADREKHLIPIKLLVTVAEKAILQAAAARASLPLATHIRVLALREARDEEMSLQSLARSHGPRNNSD